MRVGPGAQTSFTYLLIKVVIGYKTSADVTQSSRVASAIDAIETDLTDHLKIKYIIIYNYYYSILYIFFFSGKEKNIKRDTLHLL